MESFTLFRAHLAMSGIDLQQTSQNSHSFNLKNLTVLTSVSAYLLSIVKLLDDIKTFEEYAAIVYRVIFSQLFLIFYIHIVWKTPELFGFLNCLEQIIEKSK